MSTFLSRNGYLPRLYIAGRRVPSNQITGRISIQRVEDSAAIMTVTLNPATGTQDFNAYEGKDVILDIQTSGGITRVFTGKVDLDEYDLMGEFINLRCTQDRRTLVEGIATTVNGIGYYSSEVFGQPETKLGELENRLTTIPYSLDFDAYNNYHLTSWTPKATADYTLGNSDIYRREPRIQRTQRARILNKVNIDLSYTYQRLHHREKRYTWSNGVTVCDYLIYGHSLCQREMIRSAALQAGWPIKGNISYTDIYHIGSYKCRDPVSLSVINIGFLGTTFGLEGSGISYNKRESELVNGSPTPVNAYDKAGNQVITTAASQTLTADQVLCIGAQWTATKRWTQNMKETYSLSVSAPQSTSLYGNVEKTETFTMSAEYDSADWENYKEYSAQSGGTNLNNQAGTPTNDYIIDQDTNRGTFNNVVTLMLNRAKTSILKSHRENRIIFQRSLWPEIDLKHTVAVNTSKIVGKGKVYSINHQIDCTNGDSWTEIEIAFYTSTGNASDSVLVTPTKPTYVPVTPNNNVSLGSHYGEDPTQSAAARWTGHIGNRWIRERKNYFRTQYPEAFIVDTPTIENEFREDKELVASQAYTLSIPNTTLTITFSGKKDR